MGHSMTGWRVDLLGLGCLQAVLYLQHNNNFLEEGTELGEQELLAFSNIRVSIHHVITDRIDHLRPSQQLTLKVSHHCPMGSSVYSIA